MSTLQLSLAIVGGIILVVIVAYNAWSTHRNAPKRARPDAGPTTTAPSELGSEFSSPLDPDSERDRDRDRDRIAAMRMEPSFETSAFGKNGAVVRGSSGGGSAPFDSDVLPVGAAAGVMGESPAQDLPDLADPALDTVLHRTRYDTGASADGGGHKSERRSERHPSMHLDPLIDAIASLLVENLVQGEVALSVMPATRRAGSKPFTVEGYNAHTKQWEYPQAGQRYMAFQAGVQRANRTGALNPIEFSEFVAKTQVFADALNASPEFPDMQHEVALARELDQFASEHDAQLNFTLRARQTAWSPGYVQQCAARLGLVPSALAGRMVLPCSTPGQPPLLTLGYDSHAALSDDPELSALCEVELALDVPQVHREEQPFARLREVAAALCQSMDAVLCDQNGLPLPTMAMDPITADLEQLYDKLDQRQFSAGSVLAQRLFS